MMLVGVVLGLCSLSRNLPSANVTSRARDIFAYYKRYNYRVVETGEVITFEGIYGADKSQAASLVLYTFVSQCLLPSPCQTCSATRFLQQFCWGLRRAEIGTMCSS